LYRETSLGLCTYKKGEGNLPKDYPSGGGSTQIERFSFN